MEQQALKGVHENETLISHHPSCKSSWYTLIRDTAARPLNLPTRKVTPY